MIDSLSIVIPAYNESATIAATVADALAVGTGVASNLEVVVCDDGSRDDTAAIVTAAAGADRRVRLLRHRCNHGIEASIRDLYASARATWIFLNSADRQWPMTALLPMEEAASAGADLVLGVRRNKREVYSPYRRVLSWTYGRVVRALGAPGGDPASIKLGRRSMLDVPLVSRGVFAEGERIVRAARGGALVAEVPVEFRRRGAGVSTGARRGVVVWAALDMAVVTLSLATGWPTPTRPAVAADEPGLLDARS